VKTKWAKKTIDADFCIQSNASPCKVDSHLLIFRPRHSKMPHDF
jgi:hypothetical protein